MTNKQINLCIKLLGYRYNTATLDITTTAAVLLNILNKTKVIGLVNYFKNESIRLHNKYSNYYSDEIIPTLEQLMKIETSFVDLEYFLIDQLNEIQKNNYNMLEAYNLLERFKDFDSNFRGSINKIVFINNYYVIETTDCKTNKLKYYNNKNTSIVWDSIELALVDAMFDSKYTPTLMVLLNN